MKTKNNSLINLLSQPDNFITQRANELVEASKCNLETYIPEHKSHQTMAVSAYTANAARNQRGSFRPSLALKNSTYNVDLGKGENSSDLIRRRRLLD